MTTARFRVILYPSAGLAARNSRNAPRGRAITAASGSARWRDISERQAAEAKLAESYRLASVGVLASGFSHEMNTPLATTLMCVKGILVIRNSRRCSGDFCTKSEVPRTKSAERSQPTGRLNSF